jgi:HAMP domain-containing protein
MADQPDRLLEPVEQILILAQVERELDAQVREENTKMSRVTDKLRQARGALNRASTEVEGIADEIVGLETSVKDLAKSATAPVFAEMGAIKKELNEMVNELKDFTNGGPPLDSSSTSSGGPAVDRPAEWAVSSGRVK